jgi:hypothetical protein
METTLSTGDFHEIPEQDLSKINGGIYNILAGILVAVVAEVISDWDNFKNGLMGRPENK